MKKLDEIRDAYLAEGFSYLDAGLRTCQDSILALTRKVSSKAWIQTSLSR